MIGLVSVSRMHWTGVVHLILWLFGSPPVTVDPFCCLKLGLTSNLADEDNALGLGMVLEHCQGVYKVCTRQYISAHPNDKTLPKPSPCGRCYSFIAQSA